MLDNSVLWFMVTIIVLLSQLQSTRFRQEWNMNVSDDVDQDNSIAKTALWQHNDDAGKWK